MADEAEVAAAEAAAAAKKKKKMMIVGGLLAAAVVYRFVLAPGGDELPPDALASTEEVVEVIPEGEIIAVPEMTLNLAASDEDAASGLHYARIGIALVLVEGVDPVVASTKVPLVQDVMVDTVSSMTFEELRAPGALQELKVEVSQLSRDAFVDDPMVARVVFTSFVIQ
ncbi:MAG: flagellar basal body-associated FliL family protein, partial [Acidimicrobiia bacterium]|nr:flagellar basal body-associated FliL family protein [Acidimicrobiia bacterium]